MAQAAGAATGKIVLGGSASDHSQATAEVSPKTAQASDANLSAAIAITVPAAVAAPTAAAAGQGGAIVSQIADQVIRKVDGKSTSFDIALNPAGLGQVNVKVQIDASGQISASLSFNNPHAAAEAQSRAGDLQQALQHAGFNLSQNGLSFGSNGAGAGFAGQNNQSQGGSSRPTSQAANSPASDTLAAATAASLASGSASASSGVDIRI
jgi:flagellar hook-length control protein FliK